ncbi:MAG TPA: aminopeptidase P N-terminal domain-containing protein [Flavisolibacter sp.]
MFLRFCRTLGLLLVLASFLPAAAQKDLPKDFLPASFHEGRREAARALMPANSVMVVFAAPVRNYANDVDYNYHPNPDLYYFTGYREPDAILFLFKEPQKTSEGSTFKELFFVQARNAAAERWTGRRLGVDGVKQKLGFTSVLAGRALKDHPLDLAGFDKVIMPQLPEGLRTAKPTDPDLAGLLAQLKQKAGIVDGTKNERVDVRQFYEITGKLREIKTPEELVLIRKAVEISCQGQNEVMKAVRPDMSELEIQGLHEFVHKKYGAEGVGYGSIVGSGENGCILHYTENSRTRVGTDLLLMDVGAEYHGYTADVTRTIPAGGKFSAEQRLIYNLVYEAQEAAFKTLKNGASWSKAGQAASDIIANGLLKLGIIKKAEDSRQYYPHGLSHHIGLDVHDRNFSGNFKTGMVITVEPGIYIPEGSACDKKWWGIAVRIEDDVLIRENDYELLSDSAPRTAEAIEKLIAEKSALDGFELPPLPSSKKKAF